jgi:hypothetical protein
MTTSKPSQSNLCGEALESAGCFQRIGAEVGFEGEPFDIAILIGLAQPLDAKIESAIVRIVSQSTFQFAGSNLCRSG